MAKRRTTPIKGAFSRLREAVAVLRGVREAAGHTIDDDDADWRKLTGATDRDLSPLTQARMQKLAVYQWERNLLANRLIELPVAYLLAEGVSVRCQDPEAQDVVDGFWHDPVNAVDRSAKSLARELLLFGEQALPLFVNEANGHVRFGSLDPAEIETIVTDPDNRRIPIGLVTTRNRKGKARRYRIVHNGTEADLFTTRTQGIRETFDDGDTYYIGINRLTHGSRGRSLLLAQIDWLDSYDQFLFGEMDRAAFMRAFVWDVTLTGATEDQVNSRARKISAPRPGSVRVHNDSETWSAVSPSLGSGETDSHARLLRNHILGGGTYPEHWYGGAENVNRATGESMSEPTLKVMSSMQQDLGWMLADLCVFAINRRYDPTGRELLLDPYRPDPSLQPEIQWPELTTRDTSRYAAALSQTVVAAAAALADGLITERSAVGLIAGVADKLGVSIDADAELEDARTELAQRQAGRRYDDQPDAVDAGAEDDETNRGDAATPTT